MLRCLRRPCDPRAVPAALLAAALVALSHGSAHAVDPVNTTRSGVAIEGFDPVAYFEDGRPVQGSADHSVEWNGATWWFASAEHRDAFAAEPERYAPQYGGWCAYAVSEGSTARIDPEAWTIRDGKLYLNYSKKIERRWLENADERIAAADRNWPALLADD